MRPSSIKTNPVESRDEESDTTEQLHFHFSLSCIGEGNATHSGVLAWRIPGTGEPGGLPSMSTDDEMVGWHH